MIRATGRGTLRVVTGVRPKRSKRRLLGALILSLAAVGLAPAAASAAWTAPLTLSAAGQPAVKSAVGVDPAGNTTFIWLRSDGINFRAQVRRRSAAGALTPVHTLPGVALDDGFGEAFAPRIAVDSDGDAVFVWTDFDGANSRIRASSLSAGGVFGPARYLSLPGEDASEPQVAVDLDGDAVFTWVRSDNGVNRTQSRAMTAAGALGPVQNLSPAGVATECPQVAVDSDGDSVISWTAEQGTPIRPFTIQARARNGAGGLSAVQTISLPLTDLSCSDVGVDSGGDAIFTWSRLQDGDFRAESRSRSAAGTLGSRQILSRPGDDGFFPQVGVDVDGDAVFVWTRVAGGFVAAAQGRARSAAGVLSPIQTIRTGEVIGSQVAVDSDGDAVFTWRRNDGSNSLAEARTRSATTGALGPLAPLSAPGASASAPRLDVSTTGAAAASWDRSDGTNTRVQAAFGP